MPLVPTVSRLVLGQDPGLFLCALIQISMRTSGSVSGAVELDDIAHVMAHPDDEQLKGWMQLPELPGSTMTSSRVADAAHVLLRERFIEELTPPGAGSPAFRFLTLTPAGSLLRMSTRFLTCLMHVDTMETLV